MDKEDFYQWLRLLTIIGLAIAVWWCFFEFTHVNLFITFLWGLISGLAIGLTFCTIMLQDIKRALRKIK